MKKLKLITLFLALTIAAQAQSVRDVFTNSSLVWYGIDLSKAKFIGSTEAWGSPQKLKDTYFGAWNSVVVNESDKYNLRKFFRKDQITIDLKKVKELNDKVSTDSLIVTYTKVTPIPESTIVNHVAQYIDPSKKGVGLVFIVEYFSKLKEVGLMHVVFFDPATGNIHMIKTMEGKAGGMGLRNFWAKSIFNVMDKCDTSWNKWKKEAGVK